MRRIRLLVTGLLCTAVLLSSCTDEEPRRSAEANPEDATGYSLPTQGPAGAKTVTAEVLPGIAHSGSAVAPADAALPIVSVVVSPANPGGIVVLEARTSGGWIEVDRAEQDPAGEVVLETAGDRELRVVVPGDSGQPALTTEVETTKWNLAFVDEFSGTSFDPQVWDYRQLGEINPEADRGHAASAKEAIRVNHGAMHLYVLPFPGRPGFYYNGHISTEDRYSFKYGIAAARIRFQQPRGMHGAYWLQSPTFGEVPGDYDVSGSEVDVAEFFGQGYPDGGLAHMVHFVPSSGERERIGDVFPTASRALSPGQTWWTSYHVFSLEWTPEEYIFRIDGRETYRTSTAVSGTELFLVLSLLNSDWELPKLPPDGVPASMSVDWVRIWQE